MISREDIKKLAHLSRIELSEEEEESFVSEIESILGYVGQVTKLSPMNESKPREHRNVFRFDENPHESGVFTEALLKEAPSTENGYIKVKKILSND